jgi:TolB-like protein
LQLARLIVIPARLPASFEERSATALRYAPLSEMNPRNFLAELQRRRVYRVAVSYAVVAWLLIQIAATTFPAWELPPWALRLVIALAAFGLVPALILSWAFDVTPEGIKRAGEEARPQRHRRKFTILVGIAAVVAAGLLAVQLSRRGVVEAEKSIAVLPFESLSDDKANAYFAMGVQDEILTRLAKIGDLKVISRSSTQSYRSAGENIAEIARQLGVAHVVEGRVQKAGDSVRVNVRLIRAATEAHIWADTYDRKVTDVFAIQSEIASSIADALNARLTGAEKRAIAQRPTENPQAYDAYLRGLALLREGTPRATEQSLQPFEEAVRLDPNFAGAWAMLARVHSRIFFTNFDATPSRREAAERALQTALRLQPQLPEVQFSEAFYQYYVERDYDQAQRMLERLEPRLPNYPEIPSILGSLTRRQGRWEASKAYYDRAAVLNPRERITRLQAAVARELTRDFAGAIRLFDVALESSPATRR